MLWRPFFMACFTVVGLAAVDWSPGPGVRPREVLEQAMEDSSAGRRADALVKLRWFFLAFPRENPDEAGYAALGPVRLLNRLATQDETARALRDAVIVEHRARLRSGESPVVSYGIIKGLAGPVAAKDEVRGIAAAAGATAATMACRAALMDLTEEDARWAWPLLDHRSLADVVVADDRRTADPSHRRLVPGFAMDELIRHEQDRMIQVIRLARIAGAPGDADRLERRARADMGIAPERIPALARAATAGASR